MKFISMCVAILMAVLLLSCNKANKSEVQDVQMEQMNKLEEAAPSSNAIADTSVVTATDKVEEIQQRQSSPKIDWDKKIIKTANITVDVKDFKTYNAAIHGITKRYGAYIFSEQETETGDRKQNTVSIKVPVDQFDEMVNGLPGNDVKVVEKRITSEDVTGEVVDTKARVEARKQVRERYLALLKQAKTMKDILEVEQTINAIQEDIEAGAGRVQYLSHQAAYSTINLTYYQYIEGATGPNNEPTFFTKLKDAFKDGTSIIGSLLLGLVTIWPLLFTGFVIWYIIKKFSATKAVQVKKQVEVTS